MGLLTPTPENYRLREPFGVFPAGAIIQVVNARDWPDFKYLHAEKVSESATHNFTFDAAEHARMLEIQNNPPSLAPRRVDIGRDELLDRFRWSLDDLERAIAVLGFPQPMLTSSTWNSWSSARAVRVAKWESCKVNDWLAAMRLFAGRVPKDVV